MYIYISTFTFEDNHSSHSSVISRNESIIVSVCGLNCECRDLILAAFMVWQTFEAPSWLWCRSKSGWEVVGIGLAQVEAV